MVANESESSKLCFTCDVLQTLPRLMLCPPTCNVYYWMEVQMTRAHVRLNVVILPRPAPLSLLSQLG